MKTLLKVTLTITILVLAAAGITIGGLNLLMKSQPATPYCAKHDFSKQAHTNMDRELRAIGLAPTPAHTHYFLGITILPPSVDLGFSIQPQDLAAWLAHSPALARAKKLTKPGKTAYLYYHAKKHRAVMLVISTDKETQWTEIDIETIDLQNKPAKPEDRTLTPQNAQKILADMPNHSFAWER